MSVAAFFLLSSEIYGLDWWYSSFSAWYVSFRSTFHVSHWFEFYSLFPTFHSSSSSWNDRTFSPSLSLSLQTVVNNTVLFFLVSLVIDPTVRISSCSIIPYERLSKRINIWIILQLQSLSIITITMALTESSSSSSTRRSFFSRILQPTRRLQQRLAFHNRWKKQGVKFNPKFIFIIGQLVIKVSGFILYYILYTRILYKYEAIFHFIMWNVTFACMMYPHVVLLLLFPLVHYHRLLIDDCTNKRWSHVSWIIIWN